MTDPDGDEHDVREFEFISEDGVPIRGDVRGHGDPTLVFVHGWAGRRQHWDAQRSLAGRHRVVRIDLAGHGDSGRGRSVWSVDAFADDVIATIDGLAVEPVVVIGHSLGGSVVVAAAERLGTRAAAVVGVDTWSALGVPVSGDDAASSVLLPEMRADYAAAASEFARAMCGPTADAALVARIVDDVTAMSSDIAIGILDDAIQRGPDGLTRGIRSLTVPLSAIASETFRPKDPELLRSFGIDAHAIPGTGHYLMLERPSEFNRILEALIPTS